MLTYVIIHLWCWMWGLKIGETAACVFTFFSVIETIAEIAVGMCIARAMYDDGLRIGRENGRWWIKWDEKARKSRW